PRRRPTRCSPAAGPGRGPAASAETRRSSNFLLYLAAHNLMNRTFLVTGGVGFVGQSICRILLRNHCRVRTLDLERPDPSGSPSDIEHVQGDIRDAALVRRV